MVPHDSRRARVRCALICGLLILTALLPVRAAAQAFGWINNMGGAWSSSGNWSPEGGPPIGPGYSASITLSGNYTVTVGTVELDSLTYDNPFGTLTGGNLILDKGFNWGMGTVGGPFRIECDGDSAFYGDSSQGAKDLTGTFVNGGTVTWSGSAGILFANGGVVTNNGSFNCLGTGAMINSAGANLFFNSSSGTFSSQSGSASLITIPVVSEGSIQVQGGSLTFENTLASDGPVTISSIGSLIFSAGPQVLLRGPVKGPGFVNVVLGQLDVTGGFTAGLNLGSGNVNFNGSATASLAGCNLADGTLGGSNLVMVSGPLVWTGGSIASSNVVANGGLNLAGANLFVSGGTLVNASNAVWSSGGSFSLGNGASFSNAPGATFNTDRSGTFVNGSVPPSQFNNGGNFVQTGGNITSSLLFNNSGNVDMEGGALILQNGGTNSGTFTVSSNATFIVAGGSEWSTPGSSFLGTGLIFVQSGSLNVAGDMQSNAVVITGGTLNCLGTGNINPYTISLSSGTLGGSTPLTLDGGLNLVSGTLSDVGGLVARGLLTISNSNAGLNFVSNSLVNLSQAFVGTGSGGIRLSGGSVLSNAPGALFDIVSDVAILDNGGANHFANAGVMRLLGGLAGSTFSVPFWNYGTTDVETTSVGLNTVTNTGLFNVVSNASVAFLGGTQWFNPASNIEGDGLFRSRRHL